jgi:hypothetical protein
MTLREDIQRIAFWPSLNVQRITLGEIRCAYCHSILSVEEVSRLEKTDREMFSALFWASFLGVLWGIITLSLGSVGISIFILGFTYFACPKRVIKKQ